MCFVDFPPKARGWVCLNASGLSADQRAIVTAKTQGDLKMENIMPAMRSCFPDFKAGKRQIKSVSAYVVQHGETEDEPETGLAFEADGPDSVVFDEVEAFLTEHGFQDTTSSSSPPEVFDEAEVAEVLAATWPEKRTEISKLQKARKFKQAASMKKQFSKDLTDIQKRSRCRRCGQIGHWASSCPQNSGTSGQNDKEKVSGAAMVTEEVYLVSSPGYGIMDSGCSRTLIGQQTLGDFMRVYQDRKMSVPESRPQQNLFRFGNGQEELSERVMSMPVIIRGQSQFMQGPTRALTRREHRCLMAHHETWSKEKKSTCAVAELFSPPRFSELAEARGERGLSFDIKQGWDLLDTKTQKQVDEQLEEASPELLVCCPECKHWGGWCRLNKHKLSLTERLHNQQIAQKQADFCVAQIKRQLKRGGRVLVEHPWSSDLWRYPPMRKLVQAGLLTVHKANMCAHGLVDPENHLPALKPTGLAVSHSDMASLAMECPGHTEHQSIVGHNSSGQCRSTIAAEYTKPFARVVFMH